jgi:hypothetical protein
MEQVLDRRELEKELQEFASSDQILHIDLTGRDPDEGCTRIPYFKGALFLRQMEQVFGRPAFDQFLRSYFDHFAFQSITTAEVLTYLRSKLFNRFPEQAKQILLEEWVFQSGLPLSAPRARSERLENVAARGVPDRSWNTQEWLEFFQIMPRPVELAKLRELDDAWHLTETGNSEILDEWLLILIESGYESGLERLERFLMEVGRTKLLKPLYTALMKTVDGQTLARLIYTKARPGYHPITQTALDKIVHFSK